jgi:hypothetical protein
MLIRPPRCDLQGGFSDEYEFCDELRRAVMTFSLTLCNVERCRSLFDQGCRDIQSLVSALKTVMNTSFVRTD